MTVRKSHRGKWMIDVDYTRPDGTTARVRKVSPVQTRRGAEEYERQVRQALLDGTYGREEEPEDERVPTLAAFVDRFMSDYAQAHNRPSELRLKRQILRDHLVPAFGHLQLDQITAALIDSYKAEKLAAGLRPNTVGNHVTLAKRMLAQAQDWGLVESVPRIRQMKRTRDEVDFLDFEEAPRFLDHAGEWRTFMLVAIRTGLRLGELRGLQWGDVDLANRRVRVSRAYTKDGWGEPKSGKGRTVDLPTDAVDALTAHKPSRVARTALVFPGPEGQPVGERAVYNACLRAGKAAGLGRVVGPHKLRHTFASHHAMAGTPLPVIQAWMGHADISTTMIYAHLCPSTTAAFADRISSAKPLRLVADAKTARHHGGTALGPDHENRVLDPRSHSSAG